jgi:hypothetical protein
MYSLSISSGFFRFPPDSSFFCPMRSGVSPKSQAKPTNQVLGATIKDPIVPLVGPSCRSFTFFVRPPVYPSLRGYGWPTYFPFASSSCSSFSTLSIRLFTLRVFFCSRVGYRVKLLISPRSWAHQKSRQNPQQNKRLKEKAEHFSTGYKHLACRTKDGLRGSSSASCSSFGSLGTSYTPKAALYELQAID